MTARMGWTREEVIMLLIDKPWPWPGCGRCGVLYNSFAELYKTLRLVLYSGCKML